MKVTTIMGIWLVALSLAAPSFASADDSAPAPSPQHHKHHRHHRKAFKACVEKNGGSFPALTSAQRKDKWACVKQNPGDWADVKKCEDQAGLPSLSAATEQAIATCKAEFHNHKS